MLVDANGIYYGVLGGGCFEGDLVERARTAISTGKPSLVEYDMRGDEDLIWGLGLGCNGLVKLLLGVCRGLKMQDKREQMKEKTIKRDIDRAIRRAQ